MHTNIVEIQGLTKSYGKSRGIVDVNLSIVEGEIFGFIGPNGAGKSTTIRTLLGLMKPTSGTVSVLGHNIEQHKELILEEVGYLPSEVFYYDRMRARDLLQYSASFYKKDCSRRITELAELLELDLSKKIEEMSLGNKKKVGIIQGLLHSPKLLILDEPTSGLDPLIQKRFFDLILEENRRGVTVLFSSHILSEVQKICHRVAIMKEGSVIAVQDIAKLKETSFKKVNLVGKCNRNDIVIEGMTCVEHTNDSMQFLYKGDCNELVRALMQYELTDLEILEPNLEELFLHYYS